MASPPYYLFANEEVTFDEEFLNIEISLIQEQSKVRDEAVDQEESGLLVNAFDTIKK